MMAFPSRASWPLRSGRLQNDDAAAARDEPLFIAGSSNRFAAVAFGRFHAGGAAEAVYRRRLVFMGINDSWTNAGIRMRLEDGSLYRCPMDQDLWEFYDFNRIYAGFYPACLFTALSVQRGLFYAAAIDAEGETHVYTSIAGEVWDAVNLTTTGIFGRDKASGRVLKIFGSTKLDQVFLLTDAGQLITLPNCPKCVRILRLGGNPVTPKPPIPVSGSRWRTAA